MDKITISAFFWHKMTVNLSENKGNFYTLVIWQWILAQVEASCEKKKKTIFQAISCPLKLCLHLLDFLLYILVDVYENKMLSKHAMKSFYFVLFSLLRGTKNMIQELKIAYWLSSFKHFKIKVTDSNFFPKCTC